VVALTKSTGSAVNTYFGYNTFGAEPGASETVANPFRFTGRDWDSETSLYYYRARYYDPLFGRFLSEDLIRFGGAIDFYTYVGNSPANRTDSTGLKVEKCCRPAQILFGLVDHCWLRTGSVSAGMGNLGGNVPGARCDCPYARTQVVDHSNEDKRPNVKCTEISDVDENCVNEQLKLNEKGLGSKTGRFSLLNNCRTFINDVLDRCSTKKNRPNIPPIAF